MQEKNYDNQQDISEAYPKSFDIDFFKTLKSYKDRINYCQVNLERISSGSSRIVYKIDNEKALKLAKNRKGLSQNEVEYDLSNDYMVDDIIAKVFDVDEENFLWIEMELAKKITLSKFKSITGIEFNDFCDALRYQEYLSKGSRNSNKVKEPKNMNDYWENEFMMGFFDYVGNYEVPIGDLLRINSYGIVGNDDRVVLIDYGLNDDNYSKYYSK